MEDSGQSVRSGQKNGARSQERSKLRRLCFALLIRSWWFESTRLSQFDSRATRTRPWPTKQTRHQRSTYFSSAVQLSTRFTLATSRSFGPFWMYTKRWPSGAIAIRCRSSSASGSNSSSGLAALNRGANVRSTTCMPSSDSKNNSLPSGDHLAPLPPSFDTSQPELMTGYGATYTSPRSVSSEP